MNKRILTYLKGGSQRTTDIANGLRVPVTLVVQQLYQMVRRGQIRPVGSGTANRRSWRLIAGSGSVSISAGSAQSESPA